MTCYLSGMERASSLLVAALMAGCSYPEFAFQPPADSAVVEAEAAAPVVDSATPDTAVEPTDTTAPALDSAADAPSEAAPDAPVDAPPECTANVGCPCGTICSAGKCVAATDCTKDNHFCPTGRVCTCVGGRLQISGSALTTGNGIVEAAPFTASDNGADLILRNYDLRDAVAGVNAMRIRPAACASGWHFRNIVIQCVTTNDSVGGAIKLSRRDDPASCRPPAPPDLLLDRVTVGMAGAQYNGFSDLEYKTVRLRRVVSNTGLLFDTWGPGEIGELIVEDSPKLAAELQGKIRKVTVTNSPGFEWWTSTPTENRSTWPKIVIFYDKASCPVGRPLVKSATPNGVDESCAP